MFLIILLTVAAVGAVGYIIYAHRLMEDFIIGASICLLTACLSASLVIISLQTDTAYQLDRAAKTINTTDINVVKNNGKQDRTAVLTSGQVIKLDNVIGAKDSFDKFIGSKDSSNDSYPNQPLRYVTKTQTKMSAWNPFKRVTTNKQMVWVYVRP